MRFTLLTDQGKKKIKQTWDRKYLEIFTVEQQLSISKMPEMQAEK